jgi:hypothetical protein
MDRLSLAPFRVVKDARPDNVPGMVGDILEMARCRHADPDAIITAMADVFGMMAAQLDRDSGYCPWRDRMAAFEARAYETYLRRSRYKAPSEA